jgi:sugar phosphate isomerase/epimerase
MKTLLLALLSTVAAGATPVVDHLGLQLWSLRLTAMRAGWSPVLDQARALGFTYVEGGVLPAGVTPDEYKAKLSSLGLKMVSMHIGYEQLAKDLPGRVAEARALGVRYVITPWIPHEKDAFTLEDAQRAAADFNTWGAAFKAAGIRYGYHPHGYEFRPDGNGDTLFDLIVRSTQPELVCFEMDVFWATHGGQDPVKLLAKYPDRWTMLHVKDIRIGAPTGLYTGRAPATDDVPVGSGQVDWPAVFREAQAIGVRWYFIEDESVSPPENIPLSVAYIRSLKL